MIDKDTISKGPKKRDPLCYETQHTIIIPKGTILRQEPGKTGIFNCPVAYGAFSIDAQNATEHPDTFKRVVA